MHSKILWDYSYNEYCTYEEKKIEADWRGGKLSRNKKDLKSGEKKPHKSHL